MRILLVPLGVLVLLESGCVVLPRCVTPAEAITKAEEITNTPCAAKLQKKDGSTGTYVIIHSTIGYLGEEKP